MDGLALDNIFSASVSGLSLLVILVCARWNVNVPKIWTSSEATDSLVTKCLHVIAG